MKFRPALVLLFAFTATCALAQSAADLGAGKVRKAATWPLTSTPEEAQAAQLSARFLTKFHYKPHGARRCDVGRDLQRAISTRSTAIGCSSRRPTSTASRRLQDQARRCDLRPGPAPRRSRSSISTSSVSASASRMRARCSARVSISAATRRYQFDREKTPWAKNEAELDDLWRKRIKNDWLRLKLAGKTDKDIRETLDKRYANYLDRVRQLNSEDVFQTFMNAYAMAIEPHTNYLGPRASRELRHRDEAVARRHRRGAAARRGLHRDPRDRARRPGRACRASSRSATASSASARATRPDHRRGRLAPRRRRRPDPRREGHRPCGWRSCRPTPAWTASTMLVALTRKKVSIEEQAAKKSIIEVKDGDVTRASIGVISLPTFYQDFEARRRGDKDYKSATRDVARLLGELKKDKVDGVVVDLRNNGGGSLAEATRLTGLFIDKGPVVQVRNAEGQVEEEERHAARHGLGRPAGGAGQPRLGVGLGNLRRGDPGLRPRPHHRRADLRQGHGAESGRPRPLRARTRSRSMAS